MKKINPIYAFIAKNSYRKFEIKRDSVESNCAVRELEDSAVEFKFCTKLGVVECLGRSIIVHELLDDKSKHFYHWNIRIISHSIKFYFDEKDCLSLVTVLDRATGIQHEPSQLLTPPQQEILYALLQKEFRPLISRLHLAHMNFIQDENVRHRALLNILEEKLASKTVSHEEKLLNVRHAISVSEELVLFNFKTQFLNATSKYLRICENILEKQLATASWLVVDNHTSKEDEQYAVLNDSSVSVFEFNEVLSSDQEIITAFNTQYKKYLSDWEDFKSKAISDVGESIHQWKNFGDNLRLLAIHSVTINRSIPNDYYVVYKANIGFALLRDKFQDFGVNLLIACLQNEVDLARHSKDLTQYVSFITNNCIDDLLQANKLYAIEFLIKHDVIDVDNYISLNDNCLLVEAFRSQNIDLFTLLLKHKANCFVIEDSQILAHTVLQSSKDNIFHVALLREDKKLKSSRELFYQILIDVTQYQLLDVTLTSKLRKNLLRAQKEYTRNKKHFLSDLPASFNQTILNDLHNGSSIEEKISTLTDLENKLQYKIQHNKMQQQYRSITVYLSTANDLINYRYEIDDMTPELRRHYLDAIDKYIQVLSNLLVLLEYEYKAKQGSLTKNEYKIYKNAVKFLVDEKDVNMSFFRVLSETLASPAQQRAANSSSSVSLNIS